jgi:hypothetical protein
MAILSSRRRERGSRRSALLGGASAAIVGAATVVVGTQFIGVAPPAGHISPYCDQAYQCIQPLSDPLTPCGAGLLVHKGTAL